MYKRQVYIGIPFCPTRCAYCSFVSQSIERFGEFLPAYLDALLREIPHTGKLLRDSGFHIRTLYIGGGTPPTLSSAQMAQLLEACLLYTSSYEPADARALCAAGFSPITAALLCSRG